jgi:hypothetical protein
MGEVALKLGGFHPHHPAHLSIGNNVRQLINIMARAERIGAPYVLFPPHKFLNTPEKISLNNDEVKKVRREKFFHGFRTARCPRRGTEEKRRILKQYFPDLFPLDEDFFAKDDELVFHVRSGDIFSKSGGAKGYRQPPLCFYTESFKISKCPKMRIVTEKDRRNPAIAKLKEIYGEKCEIQTASLKQDISTMLTAKHFGLAKSTLSHALANYSDTHKFLYNPFFKSPIREGATSYHFKFPNYIPAGKWKNTAEQREMIISQKDIELDIYD